MKVSRYAYALLAFMLLGVAFGEITYEEKHDPEILIIFMFFGMVLGCIATFILTRYAKGVPYTVVMFLLGAVLAGIVYVF